LLLFWLLALRQATHGRFTKTKIAESLVPAAVAAAASVAGEWYKVYFTEPGHFAIDG
jgi:hypothetical protein